MLYTIPYEESTDGCQPGSLHSTLLNTLVVYHGGRQLGQIIMKVDGWASLLGEGDNAGHAMGILAE